MAELSADAPVRTYPNWPRDTIEDDPIMLKLQDFAFRVMRLYGPGGKFTSAMEVAAYAGVGASTITRIVRGEMIPSGRVIAMIEVAADEELWPRQSSGRYDIE